MKSLKYGIFAALSCTAIIPGAAFSDDTLWNMPYVRPSKYNYLSYYSTDVTTYLASDPAYFKKRLTSGWNYYKANFIMSSGLVNQMQGSGVGTTTAVSEGQGYGMLLALINNDQAAFNRIFQAANQYMWNSSHNSYFNWKIVNGSVSATGAATDAELDICMALIFADKLQKNSAVTKWQAFNSGGVTYSSRATQMLQSISANMTQNNYLLPGDNWAGNGINNLDPSYFATGWMHAFDQFQTTYKFTPVAATCYTVLKSRGAQFNKGQAPDWCSSSGGQASSPQSGQTYQGLGMTEDAIRTPWRICMDALWFDNSDAKTFCSNSRTTLTNYTQTASDPLALKAQLTEYTNTQTAVPATAARPGAFHFAAMWLCGAIGSKDAAYAKQCINGSWLQTIAGVTDCFGDKAQSDEYYYYNQSLAMLGFAAITGMFPNVLADTIKAVNVAAFPRQARALAFSGVRVFSDGLRFALPDAANRDVTVALYDAKGKATPRRIMDGPVQPEAGEYFSPIGAGRLAPALYVVKISARGASGGVSDYVDKIVWK